MPLLLDACYLAALAAGSPYCAYKLLTRKKIRAGLKEKLGLVQPRTGPRCAWFHCVSVGEVGLARELVRRFQARFPDCPAVVSTTTDTGRAAARQSFPGQHVFYYPFDLSPAVNGAIRRIRPACIVLMELELWPNFILTAARRNIPAAIVNGRITQRTFRRLRRVRFLVEPLLKSLAFIAVQNEEYARRLADLGAPAESVVITGNMKYDTVQTSIDPGHPAVTAIRSLGAEHMIVGGCTWPGEDELLIRVFAEVQQQYPTVGLTLAPRHAERLPAVRKLIEAAGYDCCLLSSLKMHRPRDDNNRIRRRVVLVDTFGELAAVYAAADLAFVGRSLARQHGGQNILEPAALGVPVLFGPNTENFAEAAALLTGAQAAAVVNDANDLRDWFRRLCAAPDSLTRMGAAGRAAIESRKGATEKNLALIEQMMTDRTSPQERSS